MDMDVGGGSDPYCIFFTNPPDLLSDPRHAPATMVKRVQVRGIKKDAATSKSLASSTTGRLASLEFPGVALQDVQSATGGGVLEPVGASVCAGLFFLSFFHGGVA